MLIFTTISSVMAADSENEAGSESARSPLARESLGFRLPWVDRLGMRSLGVSGLGHEAHRGEQIVLRVEH